MEQAGKVALVTGGSRGIGRSISLRLAADGAFVLVHYRNDHEAAARVLAEIAGLGGEAFSIAADLSTPAGVDQVFQLADKELMRRFGSNGLDILVNNAGISLENNIESVTRDLFDREFQINFAAPYFLIQAAIPRLRDSGRIINISSTSPRVARPGRMVYACSKGALDVLTYQLAAYLGRRQITVNAVAPGPTEGGTNPGVNDPAHAASRARLTALGRMGKAEEIADVVGFLASQQARWITGQRIEASGGFHM